MRNRPLIAVLLVLTIIGFGALIWIHHLDTEREMEDLRKQAEEDGGYIDIWAEELRTVEEELRSFDVDDYGDAGKGLGSYLFLVTEPDYAVMTDVEPALTEEGVKGHLCVSQSDFPDDEGNCSRWQAWLLVDAGWDICIEVTADTDVSDLIYRLWLIDLPEPVAAYFPDSSCINDKAAELRDAGIDVVIVRGDVPSEMPEGLTAVTCLGIAEDDLQGKADAYASGGESFVFTVGFSRQEEMFSYDVLYEAIAAGRSISDNYGAGMQEFTGMKELADKRNSQIEEALSSNIEHRDELIRRRDELEKLITSGS